jgi:hypothetical protein
MKGRLTQKTTKRIGVISDRRIHQNHVIQNETPMKKRESTYHYLKRIGANVKKLRLERKLSTTAVARASAIPLDAYRALEAGRYDADLKQLFALSQVLKVHPKEFLQGIE